MAFISTAPCDDNDSHGRPVPAARRRACRRIILEIGMLGSYGLRDAHRVPGFRIGRYFVIRLR